MKVLLAVDASESTEKATAFVGKMAAANPDLAVTVLHVVESIPDHFLLAPAKEHLHGLADAWGTAARDRGEKLLEETERRLTDAGVAAGRIASKLREVEVLPESSRASAAMGIVAEMQEGGYEVVCLGRRGTSPAQGTFVGSVAQLVLRESAGVTTWVVD